jgi:hypothetical protein
VRRFHARRASIVLVGLLASALVSTTSYAAFRTAMGPKTCCRSHCLHHQGMPVDAERCCKTHTVTPATLTKHAVRCDPPLLAVIAPTPTIVSELPLAFAHGPAPVGERAPPARSLLAQHTSLVR